MKNTILETQIREYLTYWRCLGYRLAYPEKLLRAFGRFAASRGFRGPLKRTWADEFLSIPRDANPAYYTSRHRVLYYFARHWAAFDSRVEIPVRYGPQVGYRRPEPHIYSDTEVQSLMLAARSTVAGRPLVGETLAAVIGLMACTGIRKGEAISLRKGDVDLGRSLVYVRRSKDRPLRLVPIHHTAAAALRGYASRRDMFFPLPTTDHFFLNKRGGPLSAGTFSDNFRRIRRRAGISVVGRRQPRAHDLRHYSGPGTMPGGSRMQRPTG